MMKLNEKIQLEIINDKCYINDDSMIDIKKRAYDTSNNQIYPEDIWLFIEGITEIFNNKNDKNQKLFKNIIKTGEKNIKKYKLNINEIIY